MKTIGYAIGLLTLTCLIGSCSGQKNTSTGQSNESPKAQGGNDPNNEPPAYESALPEDLRKIVDTSFSGDFDEMVKRRLVRVGVPSIARSISSTRACSGAWHRVRPHSWRTDSTSG